MKKFLNTLSFLAILITASAAQAEQFCISHVLKTTQCEEMNVTCYKTKVWNNASYPKEIADLCNAKIDKDAQVEDMQSAMTELQGSIDSLTNGSNAANLENAELKLEIEKLKKTIRRLKRK